MFKRPSPNIIIALCTAFGMIALALYQRRGVLNLSATQLFVGAAIIQLLPVVYALLRHKGCRSRSVV